MPPTALPRFDFARQEGEHVGVRLDSAFHFTTLNLTRAKRLAADLEAAIDAAEAAKTTASLFVPGALLIDDEAHLHLVDADGSRVWELYQPGEPGIARWCSKETLLARRTVRAVTEGRSDVPVVAAPKTDSAPF